MKYLLIKRVVDLFFSTLVIFIFFLPILLVLFFSIIIDRHFPIFIQTRSGNNGKKIKIYKIKSMKYDDKVINRQNCGPKNNLENNLLLF